jgi:hypothetical protein
LADLTMAVHFVVLAYIVLGAFLAWRWPRTILVHLPFAVWGLAITLGATCPLTTLENHLRASSNEGFIEHYLDGVLYPAEYLTLSRILAATLVAVGYAGAILAWRRAARSAVSTGSTAERPTRRG